MTNGGWKDPDAVEFSRGVCELLAKYVAAIAPRGVSEWGRLAFEMAAPAEAEFLIALSDREANPTDQATERLRAEFLYVLEAWKAVTRYYESHDFRPVETSQ